MPGSARAPLPRSAGRVYSAGVTWWKNPSLIGALVVVAGLLGLWPSCVDTAESTAQVDAAVDFRRYGTFALVSAREPLNPRATPELLEAMDRTVEAALAERGLRRAAQGASADVFVLVHGGPREVVPLPAVGFSYGRFRPWGYGGGEYELAASRAGTVVIDVIDARTRELVWRGAAPAPAEVEPLVASVRTVAAQFPAKQFP